MPQLAYPFFTKLSRTINSGQSHSLILSGNVADLFYLHDDQGGKYIPLLDFLTVKYTQPDSKGNVLPITVIAYELNGPIRFVNDKENEVCNRFASWRVGMGENKSIEEYKTQFREKLKESIGNPALALEFLRQMTLCNRQSNKTNKMLIIVEGADMRLPAGDGDISRLSEFDRRKIGIVQDWFQDPEFMDGNDSVVLLSEARSLIHPKVARLPQVLNIEVPAPEVDSRKHYIDWFYRTKNPQVQAGKLPEDAVVSEAPPCPSWDTKKLAQTTAGISIQSLRQLLVENEYNNEGGEIPTDLVIEKVEEHIKSQVGDDVIEFKKPTHTLDDVVGFTLIKNFIRTELIPRFMATAENGALAGAAVAGPIGGGKTFIFEGAGGEMDLPVIVLKAIRSQWYGQTDVIFERLRRVLESIGRVLIFVDEADTQFGQVNKDAHETEKRLTGQIQAMMSDPRLRGKVIWLLMTARIEQLSPDIRRPGRAGDLIIPVLDPEGDDRLEFIRWLAKPFFTQAEMDQLSYNNVPTGAGGVTRDETSDVMKDFDKLTKGWSAATFASVRAQAKGRHVTTSGGLKEIIEDTLEADIASTRRRQTLQALLNCTRRSLLPGGKADKEAWQKEIRKLDLEEL